MPGAALKMMNNGETSITEFERWLSMGLGRAILYLQTHDAAPYQDAILRCCLKNGAYDPQSEGSRTRFLYDLIELTGEYDYFRRPVLDAMFALAPDDTGWDASLYFALVTRFAVEKKDLECRQAVYDKVRSIYEAGFGNLDTAIHDFLWMDRSKAFLFLIDLLENIKYPDSDEDAIQDYEYRLEWLEDDDDKREILRSLNHLSKGNPHQRQYLTRVYLYRREHRQSLKSRRSMYDDLAELTYDDVRSAIKAGGKRPFRYWRQWGEIASHEDLLAAAQDFMTESDTRAVLAYVDMFTKRRFPLDDFSRLFHLSQQSTPYEVDIAAYRTTFRARIALEQIEHPLVRQFALDMIATNPHPGGFAGILQLNFEAGDWLLLEKLAREITDDDDCHRLGGNVLDIFEKYPSQDAVPTLIQLYAHDRCSACREYFVQKLVFLNALPKWMAEECLYDANERLRDYARRGFKDDDDE